MRMLTAALAIAFLMPSAPVAAQLVHVRTLAGEVDSDVMVFSRYLDVALGDLSFPTTREIPRQADYWELTVHGGRQSRMRGSTIVVTSTFAFLPSEASPPHALEPRHSSVLNIYILPLETDLQLAARGVAEAFAREIDAFRRLTRD